MSSTNSRYSNLVFDCGGARLRTQSRRLSTVVAVNGELDADNIDRVAAYAAKFAASATSMVLDLSGVTSVDRCTIALLDSFDDVCARAGVPWMLVTSHAVVRMLADDCDVYPIVASVPDALDYFLVERLRRRSLLLPLLTRSA